MVEDTKGIEVHFLSWLINNTSYRCSLFAKHLLSDVSFGFVGFLIALLLVSLVLKDLSIVPDPDADDISVTKLKKNKRSKIFVIIPKYVSCRIPIITAIAILINSIAIMLLPIKKIQFVDNARIRIIFWITLIAMIAFMLFSLSIDAHVILQNKHGGYTIFEYK